MITDWTQLGIVPTSGLLAWHAYASATSADGNINDLSGNGRHIVQASTPPTLTADVLYGQHGWYFDGATTNPLQTASSSTVTPKHVFILAAFDDAAFDAERGLISGKSTSDLIYSDTSGVSFIDPGGDTYLKSGVDPGAFEAPMSGRAELIEITDAAGFSLDGFSIGKRKAVAGTEWKGYFFDHLSYSSIQTGDALRNIYNYFSMRYQQYRRELPIYFPDSVLIGQPRQRFYEEPKDWDKITDSFEFEDAGMKFNTVADDTVQRWEYIYQIHNNGGTTNGRDPEILPMFEAFNNTVKRSVPFIFRDKYGIDNENVRIATYERSHREHKPWQMDVKFTLEKNPG